MMPRRPRARNTLKIPDDQIASVIAQFPEDFDPDTHRALFALRATAQLVNDSANEWLGPMGLTVGKYNYLISLASSPTHSRTLNEIGTFIHTSSATVTGMIASLERDGLVERESNPLDGRSMVARLTPAGEKKLHDVMRPHQRNIEASMQHMTRDERKQLFALLLKLGSGFGITPQPPSDAQA